LASPYYRRYGRDLTPYAFIAADSLEELDQLKASKQEVLDQIVKLDVSTSPELDGIRLRALRKLKCGTAELLTKVCSW